MSILDGVKIGDFELRSGRRSPVKIEIERMLENEVDRKYIEGVLYAQLNRAELLPQTFVGVETGGAYLALLLATTTGKKWGVVRKDGTHTLSIANRDICLVEDVVTTGHSLAEARRVLEAEGFIVIQEISLVDRRTLEVV